jgi:hypothetical protein
MQTQPGWYPDPWQTGQARYHDGRQWTGYTRPVRKNHAAAQVVLAGIVLVLVMFALAVVDAATDGALSEAMNRF